RKIPFSVGEIVMFFNVFIFGWAGFILGWEQAMYSILTYTFPQKQSMQSPKASTTQKPSTLFPMNLKNFQKRLTKGSDVRRQDYTDVEVSIQKKRISSMSSLFDLKYPS